MKTNGKRTLFYLILPLLLMLTSMAPAYAAEKTNPAYPGQPNVVWNVSSRKVVVVHVLNATDFDMEYGGGSFQKVWGDDGDHPQDNPKNIAPTSFSPSGLPHKIPAKSAASFVVSWLDTATGDGKNTNDVMPQITAFYKMIQVDASAWSPQCAPNKGDILINIGFNRVKESQPSLKGEVFHLVADIASTIIGTAEFLADPTPLGLVEAGYLRSAAAIASDSKAIAARDGGSDQVYFNAFVCSKENNPSVQFPAVYGGTNLSTTSDPNASAAPAAPYDGLYSQQGTTQGCPQAYIISAVMVQRETSPDNGKLNGSLPAVFVTLVDNKKWQDATNSQMQVSPQASSAGYKIAQQMQREGRNGRVAFVNLAGALTRSDHELLNDAYKAIEQKKALTGEQEGLLLQFAEALEKHEKAMPTHTERVPVHKSK